MHKTRYSGNMEQKVGMVIGFSQKLCFLLSFHGRNDSMMLHVLAIDLLGGTVTQYCKIGNYTEHNCILCVVYFVFSSVTQLCPTLCNPMNHSTPGLPVHHQLPEFTQTHAHRVSDAIQPSHPLSSPSPPAPNPSQHQGLFQ